MNAPKMKTKMIRQAWRHVTNRFNVLTKIKLKVYCKVRWNYWLLVIGVTEDMSIKSTKRLLWNKALYHVSRQTALQSKLNNTLSALCFSEESKSKFSVMTSYLVYSWQAVIFTLLSGGYCWPSVIPVLKVHLSDLRLYYLTIIIIRCKFFSFSLAESPPANYCLRIMVCSCAMSSNCVWLRSLLRDQCYLPQSSDSASNLSACNWQFKIFCSISSNNC